MISARVLSTGLSVGYVGSVYIFPGGRSSSDEVGVVLRRMIGVTIFTVACTMNYGADPKAWAGTFDDLTLVNVLKAAGILQVLYAAVLLVSGLPRLDLHNTKARVNTFKTLVVGPVTEELIYRGVIVSLYKQDGISDKRIILENFWYFGIAHLHHGFMKWLNDEAPPKVIVMQSLIHFIITSLFGTYACFWLLKTGSVWPGVVSHLICNYYGPPAVTGSALYFTLTASSVAAWAYLLRYV